MLINEACKKSKLTKKAMEYYEAKGLISPKVLENGYRDYSEADILTLKEISVLRKCGISVTDIKNILCSKNKSAALAKCKYVTEIRLQRLQTIQQCMDNLIRSYDVEREFDYLQAHDENLLTVKERLVLAFPGNYGLFLSLHFGRFLDGIVDTDEKRQAYNEIINYLDDVELHLPPELSEYLEEIFTLNERLDVVQLENTTNKAMAEMLNNTENYLAQHHQDIEEYHAYLKSDEFLNSPIATMQKKLRDFQKQSGYYERLVNNVKVISPHYAEYLAEIETANEQFFRAFPQAKDIYDLN
ncbi:MerR family transcriptional regulator [Paenibacillus oralis]|uniref:MerR family transcriptional regulator n=1 Tax=Paenibacillus oralis TaxID=2490856 RepID=A0A3P3TZP1_9BACL|nr:MerR family transcriptional regulator [Paenibacillus oralis]RRJ63320.1 MerR family transcriptional regulator [Paenibacillus oralis]